MVLATEPRDLKMGTDRCGTDRQTAWVSKWVGGWALEYLDLVSSCRTLQTYMYDAWRWCTMSNTAVFVQQCTHIYPDVRTRTCHAHVTAAATVVACCYIYVHICMLQADIVCIQCHVCREHAHTSMPKTNTQESSGGSCLESNSTTMYVSTSVDTTHTMPVSRPAATHV